MRGTPYLDLLARYESGFSWFQSDAGARRFPPDFARQQVPECTTPRERLPFPSSSARCAQKGIFSYLHGRFMSPLYDIHNSLRLSNGTALAAENWFAVFFFGARREQDCQLKNSFREADGRARALSYIKQPPD